VIGFRNAEPVDAPALGALHVASWRETYAGLLPAEFLDGLSPDRRGEVWSAVLQDPSIHGATAVCLAERDGEAVGFGACGSQRDAALQARGFTGEIGAVYVLRCCQGAGVGGALMRLMARALFEAGHAGASLWVLRDNIPARRFYERLGGVPAGERSEYRDGVTLCEIAYGWSDLAPLLA
jgi:ribosomal protein S18 acetylase RimI-like enzyme